MLKISFQKTVTEKDGLFFCVFCAFSWEQRKLGEVCNSFEYGLNAAAKEFDGINKYIRITDIDDDSRVFLDSDLTSPDCDLSSTEKYKLQDGDIVFARTGASVGKTFIYKVSDGLVYYAGFLIRAKINANSYPDFVFYNTLTKEYEKFIRITSQRSGQPGVNAQEYSSFEFSLPSYEEQKRIGRFFRNLAHLITLHQYKCLAKHCCFPSKITHPWEQRKLGEFGKATGGTSIESEFVEEGNYKVISIGSYSETSKYNDQGLRTNKTSKTESKILNKDDLTMILNDKTAAGNIIGRVLLVDADNSYVYNQRTERIEVYKEEFEPSFLYQLLNAEDIRSKIIKASQGNTQIYVNWSTISELKYPIPRVKSEQKKIATFFNNLDNLITLHQRNAKKEVLLLVNKAIPLIINSYHLALFAILIISSSATTSGSYSKTKLASGL